MRVCVLIIIRLQDWCGCRRLAWRCICRMLSNSNCLPTRAIAIRRSKRGIFFPPQNPGIRHESLWSYELSFSERLLDGRLTYVLNAFYIDGKNIILTQPNPNGAGMLNQNSGKIDNAGAEAQVAWRINGGWSVDANYSYLYMKVPVIAAPEHKLYVGALYRDNRWSVSTGVLYITGSIARAEAEFRAVEPPRTSAGMQICEPLGAWREPACPTLRNQCRLSDAAGNCSRRSGYTF